MERQGARLLISILLIAFGVILLLANLNLLPFDIDSANWFWVIVFGLAGLGFLVTFISNPSNWWALIPGFTLLGLGIIVGDFLPGPLEELNGAIFLGMIGLSFLFIAVLRRDQPWAVIPAGVLLSLVGVITVSAFTSSSMAPGAVLFLGMAITFILVYFLPWYGGRASWAIWPAGILGAMGLLMLAGMTDAINYVWPVALILGGTLVLLRGLRRPESR